MFLAEAPLGSGWHRLDEHAVHGALGAIVAWIGTIALLFPSLAIFTSPSSPNPVLGRHFLASHCRVLAESA